MKEFKKWQLDLDESSEYNLTEKGVRVIKSWTNRMKKRLAQLLNSINSTSEVYIQENNLTLSRESLHAFINEMFHGKFDNTSFKINVVPEQDFLLKNLIPTDTFLKV